MDIYELRKQAIDRERARVERIDAATASLPSRKVGELSHMCDLLKRMHKTLCFYDQLAEPPAVAGITETWFDAAIERVETIAAQMSAEQG